MPHINACRYLKLAFTSNPKISQVHQRIILKDYQTPHIKLKERFIAFGCFLALIFPVIGWIVFCSRKILFGLTSSFASLTLEDSFNNRNTLQMISKKVETYVKSIWKEVTNYTFVYRKENHVEGYSLQILFDVKDELRVFTVTTVGIILVNRIFQDFRQQFVKTLFDLKPLQQIRRDALKDTVETMNGTIQQIAKVNNIDGLVFDLTLDGKNVRVTTKSGFHTIENVGDLGEFVETINKELGHELLKQAYNI